ncbi:MAG: sulfur carrier protein ThiS adenylyltransferase ThiF [Desulfobacterales bacterium]|nr:sulfur carrier protein ThiS adenylyltransferase ThiF [Desulfobacterales bacterium]
MKIGIAGIGGIGSNVAVNLLRSGIRHFKIADFDKIEKSNLNRQFYFEDQIGLYKADVLAENLKRIDASVVIEKKILKLDTGNLLNFFDDCDVIVEGFDGTESKKVLIESFGNAEKLVVSASGIAGNRIDDIRIKKIGNCHIFGDMKTDTSKYNPYLPKIMIITAMMTHAILEKVNTHE